MAAFVFCLVVTLNPGFVFAWFSASCRLSPTSASFVPDEDLVCPRREIVVSRLWGRPCETVGMHGGSLFHVHEKMRVRQYVINGG